MVSHSFFPGFNIQQVEDRKQTITIQAKSIRQSGACPTCQTISNRIHSYYSRSPQDLPIFDHSVRLMLTVKRFRCLNPACPRCTFVEPMPDFIPGYAHRTCRLTDTLREIAFACGGEAGARLAVCLRMPTSPDSLLRIIRQAAIPNQCLTKVVGVDDFAFCRGQRYGTILVDLEKHCPIDVLQDRTAEGLSAWLKDHPEIERMTRDRSTEYARGITQSGSQARQIVDRWHLLRNLREAVEKTLTRTYAQLKQLPLTPSMKALSVPILPKRKKTPAELAQQEAKRAERYARYLAVQAFAAEGMSIREIALRLGVHRVTVQKLANSAAFPERSVHQSQSSILTPFLPYLQKRFSDGCSNSQQLWQEIREQGFKGSSKQVIRWMQQIKMGGTTRPPSLFPPKQLVWVLVKEQDRLKAEEKAFLECICQDPAIAQAYVLIQQFREMVREKKAEDLNTWLVLAESCSVIELARFASGIRQDFSAVYAGLSEVWSNGQTEGQNTRLKFLKRQMYGRAKLDLLRQRVLYRSG